MGLIFGRKKKAASAAAEATAPSPAAAEPSASGDASSTSAAPALPAAPAKKISGARVISRARDRENRARARQGLPPLKEVPLRDVVDRAVGVVKHIIHGKPAGSSSDPNEIEGEAEVIEDDVQERTRQLVSGK